MGDMHMCPRILGQQHIPGHCNILGHRGTAFQPQQGTAMALVHHPVLAERSLLLMVDDKVVTEGMEVIHGVQHDLG